MTFEADHAGLIDLNDQLWVDLRQTPELRGPIQVVEEHLHMVRDEDPQPIEECVDGASLKLEAIPVCQGFETALSRLTVPGPEL